MKVRTEIGLREVKLGGKRYLPKAILKLRSEMEFSYKLLKRSQVEELQLLKKEAVENNFEVLINNVNLKEIDV